MTQTIIYRHSTISRYLQANKHNAKEIRPTTRHTATLTQLYNNPHRRLPQAFAHKPNKEKRKKESQLPLCASTHSTVASRLSCLAPLVPLEHVRASRLSCLAPLEHVRLSSTCASQPRALLEHVLFHNVHLPLHLSSTLLCAASQTASLSHKSTHRTPSLCQVLRPAFSNSDLSLSSNSLSCGLLKLSTHNLTALRPALFSVHQRAPPSSGRVASAPPIARTRHPSPCRSSLWKQADDEPSQRRSARRFGGKTSPRPRRFSIRPAGSVTTRCTFDGECRWWCCVVVGEVASSRAWCERGV